MPTIPNQPQRVTVEQADGNILLSWRATVGATGYIVQRGTDGVNFATIATPGQVSTYLDSLPGIGVAYYYQIASTNGAGTSVYSSIVSMVAAPPSEMSLGELRLRCQETADRVNSQFVTATEWNSFIRLAMYELYDLLVTVYRSIILTKLYSLIPLARSNSTHFQMVQLTIWAVSTLVWLAHLLRLFIS